MNTWRKDEQMEEKNSNVIQELTISWSPCVMDSFHLDTKKFISVGAY